MGLCESADEKVRRQQNDAIEKQLAESGRLYKSTQKLLLLGQKFRILSLQYSGGWPHQPGNSANHLGFLNNKDVIGRTVQCGDGGS